MENRDQNRDQKRGQKRAPLALLLLSGAVILAFVSLKLYDEPVRNWLRKKWK